MSQLIYGFPDMFVPSVVVHQYTNVEDLEALADLAAAEKACLVFMFHRVKKQGEENYENTWSYDFDKTERFLKYLAKKRRDGALQLCTTREVFERYHSDI